MMKDGFKDFEEYWEAIEDAIDESLIEGAEKYITPQLKPNEYFDKSAAKLCGDLPAYGSLNEYRKLGIIKVEK